MRFAIFSKNFLFSRKNFSNFSFLVSSFIDTIALKNYLKFSQISKFVTIFGFLMLLSLPVYAKDFAVVNLTTVLINASGGANTVAIATGPFTNVSIGTDAPAAKLHVRGDVLIDNKTAVDSTTWTSVGGGHSSKLLVVYNGSLYSTSADDGDVFRYDGGTAWTNVTGASMPAGNIEGVVVYNGQLYVGDRNGDVFRYDGGTSWTNVTGASALADVTAMVVYNGQLYVGDSTNSNVYRYNGTGTTDWVDVVGTPTVLDGAVRSLAVYNGQLYAGTFAAEVYRYDGGTSWTDVTVTPATIGSSQAMAIYNGQLYAAGSGGDVFRYDGASTWTNVSGISAPTNVNFLTVYNGQLFVADDDGNIYRYDGGTAWTDVTVSPATITGSRGLAVYNGSLYVGANGGIRIYTANPVQSYALKFKSGEGNEIASLWFQGNMSSGQGIEGQQQHGQFIFSHGIQTQTGAYDIAEEFPTWDYSIEAGDIVVASYSGNELIEKSNSPYQRNLIGVVSTKPAVVLRSDQTGEMKLVSLAGRVPVKVSTENGAIAVGDFITSSSIPGVGMKASKAGPTVGRSLESFNPNNCQPVNSLDGVVWPADDGANPAKPCFKVNSIYVGKVLAIVDVSYNPVDSPYSEVKSSFDTVKLDSSQTEDMNFISNLVRSLSSVFAWLKGGMVG